MRRFVLVAASLAVLWGAPSGLAATKQVNILKSGFSPTSVTVTAGDTVVWVNKDAASHQVVSDAGAFASVTLGAGKSWGFKFGSAGKFTYRDALKPAEKGTVNVKAAPATVSLGASAPLVTYGSELHLGGVVSTQKPGEQVTVWQQPYGQASFSQLTVVTTTTGGAWDLIVKPTLQTNYLVKAKGATSGTVTVQVRPRVTFLPSRNGKWLYAKVYGARSFAGQVVFLQRRTITGQWLSVHRYTLGRLSGKLFPRPRRHGRTMYRIWLPATSAGGGYAESVSGTQTVTRR
jgi:plastocyanin